MIDFEAIRQAAVGRWVDLLAECTPIPVEHLRKGPHDWPCINCGHKGFHIDGRDGGVEQHGRAACVHCTGNRPTSDGVQTVERWGGYRNAPDAARRVVAALGLDPSAVGLEGTSDTPEADIVKAVCAAKGIPERDFRQYGVRAAQRNGRAVARVDAYDHTGAVHSFFDLWPSGKGLFREGEGSSGIFLPGSFPQRCERWLLVEGVKDAAFAYSMGYDAAGLPGAFLSAKFAHLFEGAHVTVVPDLDAAGMQGAERTAAALYGVAMSVSIARLPGEYRAKGGDDLRDAVRRYGEQLVRDAIDNPRPWDPEEQQDAITRITVTLASGATMSFAPEQPT